MPHSVGKDLIQAEKLIEEGKIEKAQREPCSRFKNQKGTYEDETWYSIKSNNRLQTCKRICSARFS